MEAAREANKDVVYLSIGSMCTWMKWEVDALFYGLKELGVRVIWSLKQPELLPDQNDPDFWVSSWVP